MMPLSIIYGYVLSLRLIYNNCDALTLLSPLLGKKYQQTVLSDTFFKDFSSFEQKHTLY